MCVAVSCVTYAMKFEKQATLLVCLTDLNTWHYFKLKLSNGEFFRTDSGKPSFLSGVIPLWNSTQDSIIKIDSDATFYERFKGRLTYLVFYCITILFLCTYCISFALCLLPLFAYTLSFQSCFCLGVVYILGSL